MASVDEPTAPSAAEVLADGGEMGALMRVLDWADSPIGPVASWPQSLRTAVSICLASRFPMLIWWGPELVMLYNDAYRPILGTTKHPRSMGQRGRDCWPEIWDVIGPMLEGVLTRGEATWSHDQLLLLDRNGYVEECYFTFSYSPIRDESGGIGGVFTAVTETTGRVLGERRMAALGELAARTAEAQTAEDACALAVVALDGHADLPFVALYLLDTEGRQARLMATTGLDGGLPIGLQQVDLTAGEGAAANPLDEVVRTGQVVQVGDAVGWLGATPTTTPSPRAALILPVAQAGQERAAGLLVVGLNPRRALDDDYRGFCTLVAGQIAAAIADARAYEETRARVEALAELDRAKTAFFNNVSHEFRTPLTLLLGPLEEALARSDDPLVQENVGTAQRNALRLLKLVNTLLDFARVEGSRLEAVYVPTDLAAYTVELASVFRAAVERAGLRLVVDCPPLPEPVYVDREMWEKIVLNLLSNAFKFTLAGEIAVTLRPAEGGVVLSVRDTGAGIPADEVPHLFERFYRVRGTQARSQEGSGIGLALVQDLVRLHGGTIGVESVEGAGATFTVTLPWGAAHLPAERIGAARTQDSTALGAAPYVEEALRWLPDTPAPEMAPPGDQSLAAPRARVLLADDNADMRAYLTRLLGTAYEVQAVGNGSAALAAARAALPDLVLADVMMPGLDGFALLQELRADPRTREIPIVLLSARAGEEAAIDGLQAGADDYLVKPFAARELLARVRAHVDLGRLRARVAEAERALREASEGDRARLQQVLDVLPEALLISDATPTFIVANQAAREILGIDPVGQPVPVADAEAYDTFGTRNLDGTPCRSMDLPLERAVLKGEVVRGDQFLIRNLSDGRDVPILANAAPLCDARGVIVGGVVAFQDITSIQELERAREEFLSSAAHDLKTPLTSIRGQAQLAQRRLARLDAPETEAIAVLLTRIEAGTERMVGLLDELVDVTRAQMGALLELQRWPADLVALVRGVVARQESTAPDRIRVETALSALPATVDVARVERVIANLLSNAIKYSSPDSPITASIAQEGDEAVIAVRDEGIGIPAADLPHIFERFRRGVNVVGHIQGTGIGLASARQIVALHGGTIAVESQEGAGSTFTIRLPLL